MKTTNARILIGFIIIVIIIAFFYVYFNQAKNEQQEIGIGFTGPLTGDFAIIGIENLRGIQLAVDEINSQGGIKGMPVRIVAEDDQNEVAKTLNAFEKLVSADNLKYIFTVTYSGFLSLAPRADERKVVLIESLDTSQEIADAGDNAFGIGIYDEGIGFTLADFVRTGLGQDKAAIIYYNGDAFPRLVMNAFRERFESSGGSVVSIQEYGSKTRDFRAQIEKIKAAGPKAVVVVGYDEAGFIVRQAKELGLNATLLGIDTTLSENFRVNAGDAYEGLYFTSWEPASREAEEKMIDAYASRYSEQPNQLLFVSTGYDAMNIFAQALEKSDLSFESVKSNIYGMKDFAGVSGNLTMSADGIVRSIEESIYRIENGVPFKVKWNNT